MSSLESTLAPSSRGEKERVQRTRAAPPRARSPGGGGTRPTRGEFGTSEASVLIYGGVHPPGEECGGGERGSGEERGRDEFLLPLRRPSLAGLRGAGGARPPAPAQRGRVALPGGEDEEEGGAPGDLSSQGRTPGKFSTGHWSRKESTDR
mmetsp:Transcript_25842/g.61370  ORF Transcript_25842/g.61370 Transcript_25842/m.61370 type:complete len:150 (-) Transcript_25842:116-565(-)